MPMQMGFRWYGEGNDNISLSYIKQIPGVTSIVWALHHKMPGESWEEAEIAEVSGGYEATILQMGDAHKEEIQALRAEYENLTPEELLKQEGEFLARMLYAYRNNSERDLRTAVWCALNRTDSPGFPNSVKEVCQQESQWIGYSDDNPILNDLYELAIEELTTWHNNYRPVNKDYVYMSWSSKEIKLRDTYEKSDSTRYWQAG